MKFDQKNVGAQFEVLIRVRIQEERLKLNGGLNQVTKQVTKFSL